MISFSSVHAFSWMVSSKIRQPSSCSIWRTAVLTSIQRSLEVYSFADRKRVIWSWLMSPPTLTTIRSPSQTHYCRSGSPCISRGFLFSSQDHTRFKRWVRNISFSFKHHPPRFFPLGIISNILLIWRSVIKAKKKSCKKFSASIISNPIFSGTTSFRVPNTLSQIASTIP